MLVNNVTHQRETISERPIRLPLMFFSMQSLGQLVCGAIPHTQCALMCIDSVLTYINVLNQDTGLDCYWCQDSKAGWERIVNPRTTLKLKEPGPFFFHFFQSHCDFGTILKNRYIFLIIILKFHTLISLHLEENCKNSPILLIWWLHYK